MLGRLRSLGVMQPAYPQWLVSGTGEDIYAWQSSQFTPGSRVRVACSEGEHFDPPLEDALATLTCMPHGLWMDAELGSVRRCIKARLQCIAPFTDDGYGICIDPLPVVSSMRVVLTSLYQRVPSWSKPGHNAAPTQFVDVAAPWGFSEGAQRLVVEGQWLAEPITVWVNTQLCNAPQLLNSSLWCSAAGGAGDCRYFGSVITCLIDSNAFTPSRTATVRVGRRGRTVSMVPQQDGALDSSAPLSIQSVSPTIDVFRPGEPNTGCEPAGDAAHQWENCPDDRSFAWYICLINAPLIHNEFPHLLQRQALYLATGAMDPYRGLACGPYGDLYMETPTEQVYPCEPRLPAWRCLTQRLCFGCTVTMQSASHLIGYSYPPMPELNNAQQLLQPHTAPKISVRDCRAGYLTNYTAAAVNLTQRCQPCATGSHTNDMKAQQSCSLCPRGHYSNESGTAKCHECPAGSYAPELGSTHCLPCGLNGWQTTPGAERCNSCDDGQYVNYPQTSGSSSGNGSSASQSGHCSLCPHGASCSRNGTLVAAAGVYLLIEQDQGTVSPTDCAVQACVDGSEDPVCREAALTFPTLNNGSLASSQLPSSSSSSIAGVQRISSSGLGVVNCCGQHRLPSIDADGRINVLCSECASGYSEFGGRCVQCETVQWAALLLLLLLAILLLYAMHRLTRDESGSSTLSILMYFVQMSMLCLGDGLLPYWLSVANLNLDSSQISSQCVVPMSAYGKIAARSLSPVIAAVMVLLLLALQLTARSALNLAWMRHRRSAGRDRLIWLYRALLPAIASEGGQSQLSTPSDPLKRPLLEMSMSEPIAAEPPVVLHPAEGKEDSQQSAASAASKPAATLQDGRLYTTGDSVSGVCRYYKHTLLLVLLFSYNAMTTVSLACLHSRAVGGFGQRLWQYPSIDMAQPQYAALTAIMVVVLVVAVAGCPVALALYLAWLRHRALIGLEAQHEQSVSLLLCKSYKPQFFYYTVCILLRRLALIVVITFASRGTAYSWLTILNNLFLALHILARPFKHSRDNAYETLTLLALSVQTGLLSGYPNLQQRPDVITAFLLLLLAVPVVVGVVLGCLRWYQRWKRYQAPARFQLDW
jgi:hypothetical protein